MTQQNLSSEEQISIIENSLKQASNQKTGASNYYIIWGITLTTYFAIQFLNAHFKTNIISVLANISNLFFAVGGIFSFLQSRKDDKNEIIIPINEKLYTYGWIGASICLAVLCIAYHNNLIEILCVSILLVFGLVNFIIGGVTKFKPLIIGGILSILLCIIVTKCTLDFKFLCTAIGVMFSCLIPGFMMKSTQANV